MEKHTPGPWTCQPIGDEMECNILGSRRELIATVSDNEANLISAAPELLAALRNTAFSYHEEMSHPGRHPIQGRHNGTYDECVSQVCAQNRAAILRAEGK